MMEYHDASHRMLRSFGSGPKTDGGPLAVLIVVVGLIFFIWIPMLFRRHCRRGSARCYGRGGEQQRQQAGENITEIVRISLENLRMLSLNETLSNTRCSPSILWNPIRSMNPEDRKDYISNVLVSRKILNVFKEESPTGMEDGGLCQGDSSTRKFSCRKSALLLADVVDVESTTKVVNVEPCIICLNDYVEGDILCWSQSPKCQHYMHKDCASEWLMNHEECPLCRHNYLSLDDENDADENVLEDHAEGNRRITADEMVGGNGGEEEAISVVRGGIPLFYALSHLQNLADARPNTTFRLEGIELVDGQRGIVEVQRSTGGGGRSSTSNGGMSFRVRRLGNGNVGGTTDRQHAVNAAPSSSTFALQQVIYSGSSSSSATGSSGTEGDSREDTPRHSPTPSSLPRQEGETSEIWSKAAAQEVHSITNQN